jgi:hypothetical protein
LGRDVPLFKHPVSQGLNITAPAQPWNVAAILRRRELCEDLRHATETDAPPVYYGIGKSLAVYLDGALLDPSKIRVCNLSGDDPDWINLPMAGSAYSAAIDPELGRMALPPDGAHTVQADFCYGFNADIGAGEYPRADTFSAPAGQVVVRVSSEYPDAGDYLTIRQALSALPGDGVVEIIDSGSYTEPGLTITMKAGGHIELRAADGCRPVLIVGSEISVSGGALSQFDLNGLVVAYDPTSSSAPTALVHVSSGGGNQLGHLGLSHCTLVPGWALTTHGDPQAAFRRLPTLLAENSGLRVVIQKSIVGALWISGLSSAQISDSIVDATDETGIAYTATVDSTGRPKPGGPLTLEACTIVGKIYADLLTLVSNSIVWAELSEADKLASPPLWTAPLWAGRKQEGCVRFSYLPTGSVTPRRFECIEQTKSAPQPRFYSLRFGDPGYGKLTPSTADAIHRGADDGAEMGVFHRLMAPMRETDLRVRIQEFLPVGLEFGIFYET